jgi:N-acetyl-gamma-glutamyl-phosphate reductase
MIKAGIVGATGYAGVELLRLLIKHPQVQVAVVSSRSRAGRPVDEFFPNLRGHLNLSFAEPAIEILAACDVVFFATPNGTAMQSVPAILEAGAKVIDLAADFRLRDPDLWQRWYGAPHACPELLSEAVYGLPEIYRSAIRTARLVANPGCYPTAVLLGFLPLVEEQRVDTARLVADAKSGVSGAGRKAQVSTLLSEAGENFKAYGVGGHRHSPEIKQVLAQIAGGEVGLTFVPHLAPMIRGIHATLYAGLHNGTLDLQALFAARYADEPFVDVLPEGSHPETRTVRGANQCRIAVHRPSGGDIVVVLAVIDNVVKGAAGQAVQNMNLMFGLDETLGLTGIALLP